MRIVHVTDCFLPRVGGIETHIDGLVRRQREAGHDAAVLTPTDARSHPDPTWVHRAPNSGRRAREAALGRLLDAEPFTVVHAHLSVVSPFATGAVRMAAARGIPTLVTVHSMWSGLGPLPSLAAQVLRLARLPVIWSAVSAPAAETLRKALGPDVHVQVLANAVDPAEWRTGADTATEPEIPTIVTVMRLTKTKRTLPMARILADVRRRVDDDRPIRAVVVGDGHQRSALERRLSLYGIDDWVHLAGRLDHSEVRAALEGSSVFLAPAVRESFGIAALEARSLGLPVVAHSASGVGEFITHGVEGLLGANDREIADGLARLLQDDELRASISHHNRTVPPRHDWARAVQRADDLYLDAMLAVTAGNASRHSLQPAYATRSSR